MKTRNGFVSNSSSSSFVFLAEKEALDKGLSLVHPYVRMMTEKNFKEVLFLGEKYMLSFGEEQSEDPVYIPSEYKGELLKEDGDVMKKKGKRLNMAEVEKYQMEYELMGKLTAFRFLSEKITTFTEKVLYRY